MSLIGRIFVVLFAFLAACFVAGMIVVGAVLYPEFSDLGGGAIDQNAINLPASDHVWAPQVHHIDDPHRRSL